MRKRKREALAYSDKGGHYTVTALLYSSGVKRILSALWRCWLRASSPDARSFGKSIVEQERLRRAGLLSTLLPLIGAAVALGIPSALVQPTSWIPLAVLSLLGYSTGWLNRRGHVTAAGLAYIFSIDAALASLFLLQAHGLTNSNIPDFDLFTISILIAGLVLPRSLLPLIAISQILLICVLFAVVPHDPLLTLEIRQHLGGEAYPVLFDAFLLEVCGTAIAWLSAWSVSRALIRADRADELEQAHVALHQAYARVERLAMSDPLTELPNHRTLLYALEQEVARAQRYGHPLSILFFDGDHFKRVNDTFGHSAGDAVLQELGQRMRSLLREGDFIGRYGGEEFAVLLPETDRAKAREVAERMRQAVAARPLASNVVTEGISLTVSVGVAAFPVDGATGSQVLDQADRAMYWAKRLGRNQVRTVPEAERFDRNEALATTIFNLERRAEPSAEGVLG